jgi:hypothetical protein
VSTFKHSMKRRCKVHYCAWRVIEVFEPGYGKNVSNRRMFSHMVFDLLILYYFVKEIMQSRQRPHTILAALPHNGAAFVSAVFARVMRAKFIVDVHDTWPESILGVTRVNVFKKAIFFIWKSFADIALLCAHEAFGESIRYANRANSVRNRFGLSPAQHV